MSIMFFSLGVASAMIIGLLIVVVVVMVGLRKRMLIVEKDVECIYREFDDTLRNSVERERCNLEDAKRYTDSRIDKTLSK